MSDYPSSARRRSNRRQRPAADARRRRHLQLVTAGWIRELAELVVLEPPGGREADDVRSTRAHGTDRDPRALRPVEP